MMGRNVTRIAVSEADVVGLSVTLAVTVLFFGYLVRTSYQNGFRPWMLESSIATMGWFPPCMERDLRRYIGGIRLYKALYHLQKLVFLGLVVFLGLYIQNVFSKDPTRFRRVFGAYCIVLYSMILLRTLLLWKANIWTIVPALYPQFGAASKFRRRITGSRVIEYKPERVLKIELAFSLFLCLAIMTIGNVVVVLPIHGIQPGFAADVAVSWAIITINTVLVVSSVYFADCFVHSSADILLEVQAQAAEENMRHGIGSCFRSRSEASQNGSRPTNGANGEGSDSSVHSRPGAIPELLSLSSQQRDELERSIHSSSHIVTNTLIRTFSRQVLGEKQTNTPSALSSNGVGNSSAASFSKAEVEEFDAVMFSYCGKTAAAYLVLYFLSLVVLVAYGTVYYLLQETLVGFVEVIGILMADTILFVKFTRSLYRISYINATSFPVIVGGLNAWQICLILVLARVALISMPTLYWFMGQCLMYLVAGIYLTHLSLSAFFATNSVTVATRTSTSPRHSYRPPNSVISIYTYGSSYLWGSLRRRCEKPDDQRPVEKARAAMQRQEIKSNCCACWRSSSSRFKPTMRNIALVGFTAYMSLLTGLAASGQTSPLFPEPPTITVFSDEIEQWNFGVCALLLVFNYGFAYFMILFWRWSRANNATRARRKELGFDKVNISGSQHDAFQLPKCLERFRHCILSDYVSWFIVSTLTLGLAIVSAYFVEVSLLKVSNVPIVGSVATLYPVLGMFVYWHFIWTTQDFVFIVPMPPTLEEIVAKEKARGRTVSPNQLDRWRYVLEDRKRKTRSRNMLSVLLWVLITCLIGCFGVVIHAYGFGELRAMTFSAGIFSVGTGLVLAELWFNTFRMGTPFFVLAALVFASLGLAFTGAIIVLVQVDASSEDALNGELVLPLVFVVFPAVLIHLIGLWVLRDDDYKMSIKVASLLCSSAMLFCVVAAWLFIVAKSSGTMPIAGVLYVFACVTFLAASCCSNLWRSSLVIPALSLSHKFLFAFVGLAPTIALWIYTSLGSLDDEVLAYWINTVGFAWSLLVALVALVIVHKHKEQFCGVRSPSPVPFGIPVVAYNVEHRGGELTTANSENIVLILIFLSIQYYGFYTSAALDFNAGAAVSNISLCLLAVNAVYMMISRFSNFRANLGQLDRKVGLEMAFERAQREAINRCLQISQQAMMGIWLRGREDVKRQITEESQGTANDSGYYPGKGFASTHVLAKQSAARDEGSRSKQTIMEVPREEVVMHSVADLVAYHKKRLRDNLSYQYFCRDSINYRALFHIIFVLVMRQMLTDPSEKPDVHDKFIHEPLEEQQPASSKPDVVEKKQSITDELMNVEEGWTDSPRTSRAEEREKAYNEETTWPTPGVEAPIQAKYNLRAPKQAERTTKRIVYPWGTQVSTIEQDGSITVSPASFSAVSPRKRYQLIQETLDLKRRSLARIETAPAKQTTGLFRYDSALGRAPLACVSNSTVRRQLLFADFQKETTGKSWSDPDFSATNGSLYLDWDDEDEFLIEAQEEEDLSGALWFRPDEMLPQAGTQYTVCSVQGDNPFNPKEVIQGAVGDCWLLSAMSVVALYPALMRRVVATQDTNAAGIYHVRLFLEGKWSNIVVDDRIPCYLERSLRIKTPIQKITGLSVAEQPPRKAMEKTGEDEHVMYLPMPQYCRSKSATVLWPLLVEKAYAKYLGCYEALEGGHVHNALVDLTGGFSQVYSMQEDVELVASGALWSKLFEYSRKEVLLAAGSPGVGATEEETLREDDVAVDSSGIIQGHAYSILRVVEERDINGVHQLLLLRDPWGVTKWSGAWCKHDKKRWTRRMLKRLKYKPPRTKSRLELLRGKRKGKRKESSLELDVGEDEASFWISLVDFTKHFKWLYVCQLFDPQIWKHKSVQGQWAGQSAGGPPNQPGARFNPQFTLRLNRNGKAATAAIFVSITNLTSIEEARQRALERSLSDNDDESASEWSENGDDFGQDFQKLRKRIRAKKTYPYMSLLLLDLDGKRLVNTLNASHVVASTGKYKNSRELSFETRVPLALDKTYTLFPSLYPPGEEGMFLINVHCSSEITLAEIKDGTKHTPDVP